MWDSLMKPYQNYSLKFLMKFEIYFTDNYINKQIFLIRFHFVK